MKAAVAIPRFRGACREKKNFWSFGIALVWLQVINLNEAEKKSHQKDA
jgi:hypothetical protein